MSSKLAPSPEILRSQEEAFVQHYHWLIRWALQFTNNDRARAEDLVQEVFVQFAFAHTDLSAVQNIPAYLYTSLRNTHISEVRMAGRSHVQSLSIVDYSIAESALLASDPHELYQTQEQLWRICQYACMRKQSSRAGSVLILRFFHGYHLSEVAEVLGGTYQAVRQCLRVARNETRLFLNHPDALKFIDRTQAMNIASYGTVSPSEEFLVTLRLAIFTSRQGECLAIESLRALYQKDLIKTVDNLTLAHMVSCAHCLDGVNRELGLPLLAERHPADAAKPDNNSQDGPRSSGGMRGAGKGVRSRRQAGTREGEISKAFLLRCRRRATELFEHHPRELCVSVNGHLLGSQSVNSEISRLRLDITIPEPLSFIEVMSEENARLLVMTVEEPPHGEPTQTRQVVLSERRHIEVTLRYGHPWPMLEVVYHDPGFSAESQLSTADIDMDRMWELNQATHSSTVPVPVEAEPDDWKKFQANRLTGTTHGTPTSLHLRKYMPAEMDHERPLELLRRCKRYFGRAGQLILSLFRQSRVLYPTAPHTLAEKTSTTSSAERVPSTFEGLSATERKQLELFDFSHSASLIRKPFWSRPTYITAILSLFLIGALLFLRLNITPTVTAAKLIKQASAAEETFTTGTNHTTHRVVNLETRNHPGGDLIARSRIEIWQDAKRNRVARRVYDDKGQLIAGEWLRNHAEKAASREIYSGERVRRIESSARSPQAAIRDLELWQLDPSAKIYDEMIGRAEPTRLIESPDRYVVSHVVPQTTGESILLQATLTLRKSDLHAVEQTLILQRGSETHEYKFVEVSFEQPAAGDVAPRVFELDPELISGRPQDEGGRKSESNSLQFPSLTPHPASVATAELEVEVAYLLDQFRARFGDQVNLIKTPDGALAVQGIVDTKASKEEILHALAPVINNPAVRVQIDTVTEVLERQKQRPPDRLITQEFAGSDDEIPTYTELRRYFSRQGVAQRQEKTVGLASDDNRLTEAVRTFAGRMVRHSRRALSHAIELKQLSQRFSKTQLDALTPEARARFFSMVRNHAAALSRETSLLDAELRPIFFANEALNAGKDGIDISRDESLAAAIGRLYQLALANDQTVRSAFAASSSAASGATVTPRFRLSLKRVEGLADRIQLLAAKEWQKPQ